MDECVPYITLQSSIYVCTDRTAKVYPKIKNMYHFAVIFIFNGEKNGRKCEGMEKIHLIVTLQWTSYDFSSLCIYAHRLILISIPYNSICTGQGISFCSADDSEFTAYIQFLLKCFSAFVHPLDCVRNEKHALCIAKLYKFDDFFISSVLFLHNCLYTYNPMFPN